MLIVEIISFGVSLWLGLYLLQQYLGNREAPALVWTAGGLLSYSVALAFSTMGHYAPPPLNNLLQQQVILLLAPLLFWIGALWHLRHSIKMARETWKNGENSAVAIGLVLVATIFFGLGFGLILAPFEIIPQQWLFIAISGDLLLLGYAVGVLDAFDQGESHLPHFMRSLLEAECVATLFGLQVGIVMWWVTGVTFPLVVLLFAVVASAIVLTVFARQVQGRFDSLVLGRIVGLSEERSLLREFSDSLPKAQDAVSSDLLSADNISKYTRTALSHLANMPKLATNPLIHLPIIDKRLIKKEIEPHTLVRAAELKQLLTESIERLKPESTAGGFKGSKGWRHYNSLYFPYVKGLRPYGRKRGNNGLSSVELEALDWFDREVPPRTLYNWQTAAAKIIANDLQEQVASVLSQQPH